MARHIWSVLCERVLMNVEGARISLIDVAEQVAVEALPEDQEGAAAINLAVVSYWIRDDADVSERGSVRVDVINPKGQTEEGRPMEVDLVTDVRVQTVGRVPFLPVMGIGRYEFRISYQRDESPVWQECAKIPLDLVELVERESS